MAQKFLSIKNFEKYQHYKERNPPWIKFYKSMYGDPAFQKLSVMARYLYIGLISLASESDNKVLNDPSWIAQRLVISPSDIDLRPLYRSGFLLASEASIRRYHQTENNSSLRLQKDSEKTETERASAQPRTNEVWVESLKHDPAYSHINLEHELAKMDVWLRANPGRQKSRKFVLNWLNKIDKPLPASDRPIQAAIPPKPPKNDPIGRGLWDRTYGHLVKEQA